MLSEQRPPPVFYSNKQSENKLTKVYSHSFALEEKTTPQETSRRSLSTQNSG